jgi:hypothetical protein
MVSGRGLSIPVPTKQRPSEVPFFFVDRPLARDELVVLPLRVAGVSRRCLVIDAYCTAPKCTCRNVLLWFVEIPAQPGNEAARLSPGVLLEAMENAWCRGTPLVELVFDLKTEVFGTKEQQLRQVLTEAISELHERFRVRT